MSIRVGVTGHRPQKLQGGYHLESIPNQRLKDEMKNELLNLLLEHGTLIGITGMALGVDTLFAIALIELKEQFPGKVSLVAARPFGTHGQGNGGTEVYNLILEYADGVINTSGDESYKVQYMQIRNEWIVDNSDVLIAVFDGSPSGTKNCVDYAIKQEVPVKYITEGLRGN